MIRKVFMLAVVSVLFLYIAWNFIDRVLIYNPLSETGDRKQDRQASEEVQTMTYKQAWIKEIAEKNLFSPDRSYRKPKPVAEVQKPVEPPPKRPEVALMGIVLDLFGEYIAYVEIEGEKAIPMRKGDKARDIELVDISAREVMLKWKADSMHLSLGKIKTIKKPQVRR